MKVRVESYRFAREIMEHPSNAAALDGILDACRRAPLWVHSGKSKNEKLDVVQQMLNTYFDRVLGVDQGWDYHPLATNIPKSKLAADFRKSFTHVTVQAEVQFGNMSRWYSDVFKFQTAYSQGLVDIGLCVVPTLALAQRIDSNVAHLERVMRELPSADLSITLPILVIGVEPDDDTPEIDLTKVPIPLTRLKGRASKAKGAKKTPSELNRYRLVNAYLGGEDPYLVTEKSDAGEVASALSAVIDEDD